MKAIAVLILALTGAAVAMAAPGADTSTTPSVAASSAEGMAPRTIVKMLNGVPTMNGGANIDDANYLKSRAPEFAIAFVFSGRGGEYGVADNVTLMQGDKVVVSIPDAGPYLLVQVPPGRYNVEASFKGVVEKRSVTVGNGVTRVNWNTPRASD
jgi:hypothetical protein